MLPFFTLQGRVQTENVIFFLFGQVLEIMIHFIKQIDPLASDPYDFFQKIPRYQIELMVPNHVIRKQLG